MVFSRWVVASICLDLLALETNSGRSETDDQPIPWVRSSMWNEWVQLCFLTAYTIQTSLICQEYIDCITQNKQHVDVLLNME